MEFPVYIISLSRATERREMMKRQMDRLDIRYRFFEATDSRLAADDPDFSLYSQAEFERLNPRYRNARGNRELSLSEIACAVSHCRVAREMLAEGSPWAVILEDDAEIQTDNLLELAASLTERAEGCDVFLFNSWCHGVHFPSTRKIDKSGRSLYRPNKLTVLAAGYLLSAQAAINVVTEIERNGITRMNDWWIWKGNRDWRGIVNVRLIKPDLVLQSKRLPSLISAEADSTRLSGSGRSNYAAPSGLPGEIDWSLRKIHKWPSNISRSLRGLVHGLFLRPPKAQRLSN